jgi:hypothetical protein
LEQFHFEKRWNILNDGRKVNTHQNEIANYLKSIKKSIESITDQLRAGIELLEDRRNMISGQMAEAFAIFFPAFGAIILPVLPAFLKVCRRNIAYGRQDRSPMALKGELYKDDHGRRRTKYGGDALQSRAQSSRLSLWWQEFTEQVVHELKEPLIPIFGALLGAVFWVMWFYLP